MADKDTYCECECKHYDGGMIIYKTCTEWQNKVDKPIQQHRVDEFIFVTKSKRWSRPKNNQKNDRMKTEIKITVS